MRLNDYRDEAGRFLEEICATDEPVDRKIEMLRRELALLETGAHDAVTAGHQVYDLLFLLFEVAAQYGVDLDSQWAAGRARKEKKYL